MNFSNISWARTIVYPDVCVVCLKNQPAPSRSICSTCRASLSYIQTPYCRGCGGFLDNTLDRCGECLQSPRPWQSAYSVFNFEGRARQLVHRFKYHGDLALIRLWSAEMKGVISPSSAGDRYDMITSVPLHWFKQLRRGYNQAELLAQELSHCLGIPFVPLLKRRKWTKTQASLNLRERHANLKNAFVLKKSRRVANLRILLVDDVFTTGATLASCTATLTAAGVSNIDVITIARG